jgi:hypothetical protein
LQRPDKGEIEGPLAEKSGHAINRIWLPLNL